MPKMEMDIEPIVSSKQITYNLILRTIESKIREVVAESIVLPFWDDVPFHDTLGQAFRGGIWQRDAPDSSDQVEIPDESGEAPATPKSVGGDPIEVLKSKDDRTMSMPTLSESATAKKKPRKGPKSSLLQTCKQTAQLQFPLALRGQKARHCLEQSDRRLSQCCRPCGHSR